MYGFYMVKEYFYYIENFRFYLLKDVKIYSFFYKDAMIVQQDL